MTVTIAVDAMGGDHGPSVTVPASLKFLEETPDARVLLVGNEQAIRQSLAAGRPRAAERASIHAASEIIEMHEAPAEALRRKRDSSMRVAINLVKLNLMQRYGEKMG